MPTKKPVSEPPPDWTVQIHPTPEPLLTWQQMYSAVVSSAVVGMAIIALLASRP